jgi:hypothetical protein
LSYQSDYVLRLIEQMGALIRRAMAKLGEGAAQEPCEVAGQAIGLALGMDSSVASRLSSQSLVSLLELSRLDDQVIKLLAQAIELEAEVLQGNGEMIGAGVRREQASAVRSLLGPNTTRADAPRIGTGAD